MTWRALCCNKDCKKRRDFDGISIGQQRQAILDEGWKFVSEGNIDKLYCVDCVKQMEVSRSDGRSDVVG